MFQRTLSRPNRILLITLGIAVTIALTFLVNDVLVNETMLIFLAGVVFCSLTGGVWAGIISSIIFGLVHNYFFQYPRYRLAIDSLEDAVILAVFSALSLFVGIAGDRLRRAMMVAEEAVKSRDGLLAAVSHDLRNPLASALMSIEAMKEGEQTMASPTASDDSTALLSIIERSVKRAVALVDDLVDYEKIRTGGIGVDAKPQSVVSILQTVELSQHPLMKFKMLSFKVSFPRNDMTVMAESGQLARVFSNLIGNAIKFTAEGGSIEVGCVSSAEEVQFSVRDTGPGIPPDQLPFLFDRYWQADKRSRQGLGLGLSIAKAIVESHRGHIWIESELGHGTTFYFTIPTAAAAGKVVKIA